MIYLDNAATTELTPTVKSAMITMMDLTFANPSSIHGLGRKASQYLRENREKIASLLEVAPKNLIFTSGGTESNNTALLGYALAHQDKGKHIITTALEHHSVLEPLAYLEREFGFKVTYLMPTKDGITVEQVKEALQPDTILVSIMAINNETGDYLPIKEIGQLLTEHSAVFHVDAVQAAGKIKLSPKEWNVQFLSFSAHKFHGPKGIGVLYFSDVYFQSFLLGGEQEEKHRASTENMIGIAGMTKAFEESNAALSEHYSYVSELENHFLRELEGLDYYCNSQTKKVPYVLNIGFPNYNNALLLTQLDLAGFALSSGSACTAGNVSPSHVLEAMYGKTSHRLNESIRISFSETNTFDELTQLANKLKELVGKSYGF